MIGLPRIDIIFKSLAVTAITRSGRGVVALLVDDVSGLNEPNIFEYNSLADIEKDKYSENTMEYIKMVFEGNPLKVIIVLNASSNISNCLKQLQTKKVNYVVYPKGSLDITANQTIKSWVIDQRNKNNQVKAVLAYSDPSDSEAIIDFSGDNIISNISGEDKTYTSSQYVARIAGVVAGLPLTRSSTYFVLGDIKKCDLPEDPDSEIDAGKLIIINDGEKYKIGRGVNSLTTFTKEKSEQFRKIKFIETIDLIKTDVFKTFVDNYVGKVNNTYDNQVLMITSINSYLRGLAIDGVLDPNFNNIAGIDVERQKNAIESIGTDTSGWETYEIKEYSVLDDVFLKSNIKVIDAIEDITFNINV